MALAQIADVWIPAEYPVTWDELPGVFPFTTTIFVEKNDGLALFSELAGKPTTLRLGDAQDGEEFEVWILSLASSPDPWYTGLVIADARWAWDRPHVLGRYNRRRKSGDKRIVLRDVMGNVALADDVAYHPASLDPPFAINGGKAYSARRMIEDVFVQMNGQLPEDLKFKYQFGESQAGAHSGLEGAARIEDVEVDENGRAALGRLMNLIAGAQLKWSKDQPRTIVVYNQLSGLETSQVARMQPNLRDTAIEIMASADAIAPPAIRVLFTRECELRFDHITSDTATGDSGLEPRTIDNVAPVPDPDLDGYPPGTLLTFDKLFELWGTNPVTGEALTHAFVRRQWMNPHFLLGLAEFGEQLAEMSSSQALWTARAATIFSHYYQSFRIRRRWIDRILDLRETRVAIFDTETGVRAPAQAWQDFAYRYGDRAQRIAKQVLLARNVEGYSELLGSDQARVSPAVVTIKNKDLGLVRVEINLDPYGFATATVPSALENTPSAEIGNVEGKPRFFGEYLEAGQVAPSLRSTHRVAIVVSAVPAAPVGIQQLHSVTIRPLDVTSKFPQIAGFPTAGKGPIWTVRIPSSLDTCRIAWQDSAAPTIEDCFGVRPRDAEELSRSVEQYQVNKNVTDSIALAVAAVIYGGFQTRLVGSRSDRINSAIEIVGAIRKLSHTVKGDGTTQTTMSFLDSLPSRDLFALLPMEVLQVVRQLVR